MRFEDNGMSVWSEHFPFYEDASLRSINVCQKLCREEENEREKVAKNCIDKTNGINNDFYLCTGQCSGLWSFC